MKFVVDKRIKKLDGEVEDILETSQIVEEVESIRTTELTLDESSDYAITSLSSNGFLYIGIESDTTIKIDIQSTGSYIVNNLYGKSFNYSGQITSSNITLTNFNNDKKAKIKIVLVG